MGLSAELYRLIAGSAVLLPSWARGLVDAGTDAGLVVLALFFPAAIWRARADDAHRLSSALLAPFAAGVAGLTSEGLKAVIREDRPCRAVVRGLPCPAPTDWSFPSDHAAIGAASAVALALVWRRLAAVVLPLAAAVAAGRVFIGAHYPHDVIAGFALGGSVAALLLIPSAQRLAPVVERVRVQSARRR